MTEETTEKYVTPPPVVEWVPHGAQGAIAMRNEIPVASISYALTRHPDGMYVVDMLIPAPRGKRYRNRRFADMRSAKHAAENVFRHWVSACGLRLGTQTEPRVTTTRGK